MASPAAISPWLGGDAEPVAAAPPLAGDLDVEVAVVGAGFAGLSTALALRREGLGVAVLEAETAGFGASGRNAGHLTPTIGKDLPTLTRLFGRERCAALVALAELAIRHVETLIAKHAIDCDYEPVGNVVAAVAPRQFAALDRAAEAAASYGLPGELLEPDAMRRRGLPRGFLRGLLEPHGGLLHPGRYLRGLRRAAVAAGAQLFERTPVTRLERTRPLALHTPGGHVRARHAVVATNAFTPGLGLLRGALLPVWVQLFQTEPLDAAQRVAVGWSGREGIYTAHEALESYRWTPDGRILGGAKRVRYGFRGRRLPDVDGGVAALLERTFRERFPELPDLRIARHWGGPIGIGLDFLPAVGRLRRRPEVLYALGWAGHGVAQASYAGEMLSDLLLERDGPGSALWTRRRVPLPPEPLRWLVFQGLSRALDAVDRASDRAARTRA